jgi:hypothetical protein
MNLFSPKSVPSRRRHPTLRIRCAWAAILTFGLGLLLITGCATGSKPVSPRPFSFANDTFSYANELVWVYYHDANGRWTSSRREPKPDYSQHCFVVARAARQFFYAARFDTNLPVADDQTYLRLTRKVVSANPKRIQAEKDRIVIPGYPDLRTFSAAHEEMLKAECGGAWQSYFQCGHWRMVFPFSRRHQAATAKELATALDANLAPIVHVARFPSLAINHAVVVIGMCEVPNGIEFSIYDPNYPEAPGSLTFNRTNRTFTMPANTYFQGGRVDVYQIYHGFCF